MDPIHIHHLLRQLSNEVKCPHCGAKVRPDMVSIESSSQNFCLLRIACHDCGEVFHGHAHVGVRVVPPEGNTPLEFLPALEKPLPSPPPPISEQEINTLRMLLSSEPKKLSELLASS